ncbi:MAG TPA: CinA family protein [Mesorhizobium sp.]|jgi:nicotinamide-nucleotide amidase|nr:CinA family protein [Mesorhizobium sp.]
MSEARELASQVLELCRARKIMVATAESCTGGLVAAAITDLPGSSEALERGFVTYSNVAKAELLGVSSETLARFGAVSAETAQAMATGALAQSHAQVAVSITGIAGPGGGTPEKPVGLVWFGLASRGRAARAHHRVFENASRETVRSAAVREALHLLVEELAAGQAGAKA